MNIEEKAIKVSKITNISIENRWTKKDKVLAKLKTGESLKNVKNILKIIQKKNIFIRYSEEIYTLDKEDANLLQEAFVEIYQRK